MKSEILLEALAELPEELVAEAGVRRRSPIVRVAALAACVVVLVGSMVPFLRSFQGVGSDGGDVMMEGVTFHGAIYEIVSPDHDTARERLGLPRRITGELISDQYDTISGYGTANYYAPLYGKTGSGPAAIYLLERSDEGHAGEWWYLIFCGFAAPTDHVEPETLLQVYGIDGPEDIASVIDVETGRPYMDGTDFYAALPETGDPGTCGWEGFEELVYGGTRTEEEWMAIDEQLHADSVQLRLATTDGLVAYMSYYPYVGYLAWSENYYPVGDLKQ